MPGITLGANLDPKFPYYVYAKEPLVNVFQERSASSKKKVAKLFMGEWMKILDDRIPEEERIHVRYRGGKGYVESDQLSWKRYLEIYFIDVSQGDSILIQAPEDRRILIDGGQSDDAHNFIRTKYNLKEKNNYIDFDAVVATHSDADHTQGLIKILEDPKIAVKRFYHNGLFRRKDKSVDPGPRSDNRIYGLVDQPELDDIPALSPLMKKVVEAVKKAKENMPKVIEKMNEQERWRKRIDPHIEFLYKRLDAADKFILPYDDPEKDLRIKVLWPVACKDGEKRYYPYYGDVGKTVNGNSIVLMLEHGKSQNPQRILLTGDLNTESMEDILEYYKQEGEQPEKVLGANVYKAAHHGSQHFSIPFLQAVKPDAAVISSGDDRYDVHGHPRAVLMGTITHHSENKKPAVFSTELAACFRPLSKREMKKSIAGKGQLYERAIQGIVHLRSDGDRLYMGTVFGRKPPEERHANILWKWDIWPDIG